MPPIRVLIVDDSVVIRKLVTEALSSDPDVEVVGTAANGRIGLQKIPQCNPDLVTLDIEMPDMDGIEMLRRLRAVYPVLPVVLFSALSERIATTTLDALSLGATEYVMKPSGLGSIEASADRVRDQLLPLIKALVRREPAIRATTTPAARPSAAVLGAVPLEPGVARLGSARTAVGVVVIGVSTGGPNALAQLLPQLRADLPVPVLIVQHMPPMFTRLLAERLNNKCALSVREAADGDVLKPGWVYVAPGDHHMVVRRRGTSMVVALTQDPPQNSCRPAVDVLFRSIVPVYGSAALAVVMTGMGQDGFRGCEEIHEAGGRILVQDEPSSVVWGMPGFVARAGLAQKILPLDKLASEITRITNEGRPVRVAASAAVGDRVSVRVN